MTRVAWSSEWRVSTIIAVAGVSSILRLTIVAASRVPVSKMFVVACLSGALPSAMIVANPA
jgi:hypothetical protein